MGCTIPKIRIPIVNGLIIMLGGISIGLSLSYPSPTSPEISAKFGLSSIQTTMFNVCGFICALFGSITINFLIPLIGLGWAGFMSSALAALSFYGIAFANSMWLIFLMRCINGATFGFFGTVCPVFLQEVAPAGQENLFGYFTQIGFALGFLLPTIFGLFCGYSMIAVYCSIPALLFLVTVLFVPVAEHKEEVKVKATEIFKHKKQLLIAACLMFFLQFSGINALLSNLETIIRNSQINANVSYIALGANITQILATVIAALVVDKWGNKTCWLISSVGQLVAFIILGGQQLAKGPGGLFMTGLFMEQLTYGIGTGPIPFALASQLFPVEVVSVGMGISTGLSWTLAALVCFIWPQMEKAFGLGWSFIFFAGISLLSVLFGIFVIKNKKHHASSSDSTSSDFDEVTRKLDVKSDEPPMIDNEDDDDDDDDDEADKSEANAL